MNDKQGTRGSKHKTKHVSRPPTPPKHTTTPTNRGKRRSERKRKAEEPAEVLKQLQAEEAEAQTALNTALAAAEEAAKRTTTAEDASNGPGAREGDGDPSPDASEAEWVKAVKDAETAAKALATNRAAALEADQAEKAHCRHVKGLPCDNPRCNNFLVCLRQQQLRAYVMRHPTKPKPEAEEKEETLCYNCSKPGHQSNECPDNNDWQTAETDQEWPQDKNWTADTGEQKNNDPVCYHCNQTGHEPWQCPECYNCGRPGHIHRNCPDKGGKSGKGVQEPQNYTATPPPPVNASGQPGPPTDPPPAHAAIQDAYKAGSASVPWTCKRCDDGSSHNLSACPSYKGCETEGCGSKLHLQRRCLQAPKNKGSKGGKGGKGGKGEPRNYAATPPSLYAPLPPRPPNNPPPTHGAPQDTYVPWPCDRCNTGSSHILVECPSYSGCETCGSREHLQRKCKRNQ